MCDYQTHYPSHFTTCTGQHHSISLLIFILFSLTETVCKDFFFSMKPSLPIQLPPRSPTSTTMMMPIPHLWPLLQNFRYQLQNRLTATTNQIAVHDGCLAHQMSQKIVSEWGTKKEVTVDATDIHNLHPLNNIIMPPTTQYLLFKRTTTPKLHSTVVLVAIHELVWYWIFAKK